MNVQSTVVMRILHFFLNAKKQSIEVTVTFLKIVCRRPRSFCGATRTLWFRLFIGFKGDLSTARSRGHAKTLRVISAGNKEGDILIKDVIYPSGKPCTSPTHFWPQYWYLGFLFPVQVSNPR